MTVPRAGRPSSPSAAVGATPGGPSEASDQAAGELQLRRGNRWLPFTRNAAVRRPRRSGSRGRRGVAACAARVRSSVVDAYEHGAPGRSRSVRGGAFTASRSAGRDVSIGEAMRYLAELPCRCRTRSRRTRLLRRGARSSSGRSRSSLAVEGERRSVRYAVTTRPRDVVRAVDRRSATRGRETAAVDRAWWSGRSVTYAELGPR